jgi:hypothetical protein
LDKPLCTTPYRPGERDISGASGQQLTGRNSRRHFQNRTSGMSGTSMGGPLVKRTASKKITAFYAVGDVRKQTTYAFVSWRWQNHGGRASRPLEEINCSVSLLTNITGPDGACYNGCAFVALVNL